MGGGGGSDLRATAPSSQCLAISATRHISLPLLVQDMRAAPHHAVHVPCMHAVLDLSPYCLPVAKPLAKPDAPSCLAPTMGAANRPTTPDATPAAAVAMPDFRPAAVSFGFVFLMASSHSFLRVSRASRPSSRSAAGSGADEGAWGWFCISCCC